MQAHDSTRCPCRACRLLCARERAALFERLWLPHLLSWMVCEELALTSAADFDNDDSCCDTVYFRFSWLAQHSLHLQLLLDHTCTSVAQLAGSIDSITLGGPGQRPHVKHQRPQKATHPHAIHRAITPSSRPQSKRPSCTFPRDGARRESCCT